MRLREYEKSQSSAFVFETDANPHHQEFRTDYGTPHRLLNLYYPNHEDCNYTILVTDYYIKFDVNGKIGFRNRHGLRAYLLYARYPIDTLQSRFPDFTFPSRFQLPPKYLETDTGSFIITYDTPPDADKWFYKIDEGWYVVSP